MKRLLAFGTALVGAILALTALAAAAPRTAAAPSATVPIKIQVSRDGWYRVPLSGVGGWTAPADPTLLHLYTGGTDIPFQLHGSTLEFYGQGLDVDDTNVRSYYFGPGGTQGLRMSSARARATAGGAATSGSFLMTLTERDRANYDLKILNGPANNLFGKLVCGCQSPNQFSANHTFNLQHVDTAASTGSLTVTLQGSTIFSSHQVEVMLNPGANEADLGDVTGTGTVQYSGSFSIPAAKLVEGANVVRLSTPGSTIPDRSYSDTYVLSYPHTYNADSNRLAFPVSSGTPVTIGAFTSSAIRVIDISNPTSPKELFGTVSGSGTDFRVSVTPPDGSTTLYAFADSAALTADSVAVDNQANLRSTSNQADLLIITHSTFRSALQPLIDQRSKPVAQGGDGLRVFTADVEDVYDEFSNGVHSRQAIRDFITTITSAGPTGWAVKPTNVLLVGDASYDPRNYLGHGAFDFVPTQYVDDGFTTALHEDWFVDSNDDWKPERGIGRLPVRTAAEATTVVNKLVSYANLAAGPKSELIATQEFQDYDFTGFGENLRVNQLVPRGVSVTTAYQPNGGSFAAARNDIISKVAANPTIVNYFGHGNFGYWHGLFYAGSIFGIEDVPNLTNTKPALWLMMTCLNGYFADPNPGAPALGEKLLLAPNNSGAIAVSASSGETTPGINPGEDGSQQSSVKRLQEALLDNPNMTLGDAVVTAKASNTISNDHVRRTWVLLGDPSMKLK